MNELEDMSDLSLPVLPETDTDRQSAYVSQLVDQVNTVVHDRSKAKRKSICSIAQYLSKPESDSKSLHGNKLNLISSKLELLYCQQYNNDHDILNYSTYCNS